MPHHLWFNTCVARKAQASQQEGEDTVHIDHATLIAYARKNGWKAAVNLADTHKRIADGDDSMIDTVEAMHASPTYADDIYKHALGILWETPFIQLIPNAQRTY